MFAVLVFVLAGGPSASAAPPPLTEGPYRVTEVVDGDTVKVRIAKAVVSVRLIGIDAPEASSTRYGYPECFGTQATAWAKAQLTNRDVTLEVDASQGRTDVYGRRLAYVRVTGQARTYNEVAVEQGFAWEYTYAKPYRHQRAFRSVQESAKKAKRGLWAAATCAGQHRRTTVPGTTAKPAVPTTVAPRSGCDASYPGVCIPPAPPDLDCGEITHRRFVVRGPDPHGFDADRDGVGCES